MHYYIGPWVWDDSDPGFPHWRAPAGTVGLLDFRSIPAMSVKGGVPKGLGLFAIPDNAPNPGSDYRRIGSTLDETMRSALRTLIGSQLGVGRLKSPTLNLLIHELLTVKGDHTGDTFARPLMPNTKRRIGFLLAGVRVHSERFDHTSMQHAAAVRQLREQYREDRRAALNGERFYRGVPDLEHHRRVLDHSQKTLRMPWQELVPPEFRTDDGPLQHRTTITDNFNRADSDDPGANWTEVDGDWDILNNEIFANGGGAAFPSMLRYDGTDLTSSNHYAQIDFLTGSAIGSVLCGAVRFSPSAETAYEGVLVEFASISLIAKLISGTHTVLVGGGFRSGSAPPHTDKLEIDGNDLELFKDGVSAETVTDTSIGSGTRVGISADNTVTSTGDNFVAADLAASGMLFRHPGMTGNMQDLVGGMKA